MAVRPLPASAWLRIVLFDHDDNGSNYLPSWGTERFLKISLKMLFSVLMGGGLFRMPLNTSFPLFSALGHPPLLPWMT